jgi:hypothetical protein
MGLDGGYKLVIIVLRFHAIVKYVLYLSVITRVIFCFIKLYGFWGFGKSTNSVSTDCTWIGSTH